MPKIDAPVVSTQAVPAMAYVTVPEEDLFEMSHPDIQINGTKYGPGRHYVSAELAGEIERLIRNYAKSQVRLNRPGQDRAVRDRMQREGNRAGQGTVIDHNTDLS